MSDLSTKTSTKVSTQDTEHTSPDQDPILIDLTVEVEEAEVEVDLPRGAWMYFPLLPSDVQTHLISLSRGDAPSRNQNFNLYEDPDMKRAVWLFKRARYFVKVLRIHLEAHSNCPSPTQEPFDAEFKMKDWDASERSDELPPHRYEVHLKLGEKRDHEIYLTPAEMTAITIVNPHVGRAVGDALDGPRPV